MKKSTNNRINEEKIEDGVLVNGKTDHGKNAICAVAQSLTKDSAVCVTNWD